MSLHHFEFPDVHEVSHVSAHPETGARPVTCEHGSLPVAPGLPAAEFPSTAGAGVGGMAPLTKAGEGVPAASTGPDGAHPLARTFCAFGLAKCGSCGWSDNGEMEVVDITPSCSPRQMDPVVYAGSWDGRYDGVCLGCGVDLDPFEVVPAPVVPAPPFGFTERQYETADEHLDGDR